MLRQTPQRDLPVTVRQAAPNDDLQHLSLLRTHNISPEQLIAILSTLD